MADNEKIGGVEIDIRGDFSQLGADFDAAVAEAVAAGATLAEAINKSLASFQTEQAAQGISNIGTAAQSAAPGVDQLSNSLESAGKSAHDAEGGFSTLAEKLVEFGEALAVTEGLKEFGTEALETFGQIQKASISLTALTGSAEQAEETLSTLKDLSLSDALSFPGLVQAAQRMTALGFSTEQIPSSLQAIADAAAATDKDIETVAQSFDRIALSGTVAARQLTQLGLSVSDVAEVMGVADDQVKAVFKDLDQGTRIDILTEALSKFQGTAEAAAQGIVGQFQILKTQIEFVFESIGEILAPVATAILNFANQTVLPAIQSMVDGFKQLPEPVQDAAIGLSLIAAAIPPILVGMAGFGLAVSAAGSAMAVFDISVAGLSADLMVLLPEFALVASALAAIHATGIDSAVLDTFITLKNNLSGIGELFAEATSGVNDLENSFFGLGAAADAANISLKNTKSSASDWGSAAEFLSLDKLQSFFEYIGGSYKDMATGASSALASINGNTLNWVATNAQASGSLEDLAKASIKARVAAEQQAAAAAAAAKQMQDAYVSFNNSVVDLFNSFPATYDQYIANLEDGGKKASSLLSTIEGDIQKAQSAMSSMSGAPLAGMQEWVDALTKMRDQAKQFADDDAFYKLATKIDALTDKFPQQVQELSDLDAGFAKFFADMKAGAEEAPDILSGVDPATLVSNLLNAQKQLDDSNQKLEASFTKAWAAYETGVNKAREQTVEITGSIDHIGDVATDTASVLQRVLPQPIYDAWQDTVKLDNAWLNLGVTAGGVTQSMMDFDRGAQSSRSTMVEIQQAWATVGSQVDKLAKTDLPAAVAQYQIYLDALNRTGAAQGQILQVQSQLLQLQINYNTQFGKDATDQIEKLTDVNLQMQAMKIQSQGLGDVYTKLTGEFTGAFDALGKGIADNIVDAKDWGKVFSGIIDTVAKQILETLIGGAMKQLEASLIKNTGLIQGMSKDLTDLLGGITKAFGLGGGGSGGGASVPGVGSGESALTGGSLPGGSSGDFGGETGAATGGGSSSSAGGAGGLLGGSTLGLIGVGIQALSGIVQGVQMSRLENLLGEVEVTTRKIQNEITNERSDLWSQQSNLFAKLDDWRQYSQIQTDQVVQLLQDIDATLNPAAWQGVNTSTTGGSPVTASNDTTASLTSLSETAKATTVVMSSFSNGIDAARQVILNNQKAAQAQHDARQSISPDVTLGPGLAPVQGSGPLALPPGGMSPDLFSLLQSVPSFNTGGGAQQSIPPYPTDGKNTYHLQLLNGSLQWIPDSLGAMGPMSLAGTGPDSNPNAFNNTVGGTPGAFAMGPIIPTGSMLAPNQPQVPYSPGSFSIMPGGSDFGTSFVASVTSALQMANRGSSPDGQWRPINVTVNASNPLTAFVAGVRNVGIKQ